MKRIILAIVATIFISSSAYAVPQFYLDKVVAEKNSSNYEDDMNYNYEGGSADFYTDWHSQQGEFGDDDFYIADGKTILQIDGPDSNMGHLEFWWQDPMYDDEDTGAVMARFNKPYPDQRGDEGHLQFGLWNQGDEGGQWEYFHIDMKYSGGMDPEDPSDDVLKLALYIMEPGVPPGEPIAFADFNFSSAVSSSFALRFEVMDTVTHSYQAFYKMDATGGDWSGDTGWSALGSAQTLTEYSTPFALTNVKFMADFAGGPKGGPVPEPSTIILSLIGLSGLAFRRKRTARVKTA